MKAASSIHMVNLTGYPIESYADVEMAWNHWRQSHLLDVDTQYVLLISDMQSRSLQIEMNQQLIDRGEWHMVPAGPPKGLIGKPCQVVQA